MPRHRPNVPTTPASSSTSRTAVHAGSSLGSTPPPGTIQLSGRRDEVTNSTLWVRKKIRSKQSIRWSNQSNIGDSTQTHFTFVSRPDADACSSLPESILIVDTCWIWFFFDHFVKKIWRMLLFNYCNEVYVGVVDLKCVYSIKTNFIMLVFRRFFNYSSPK